MSVQFISEPIIPDMESMDTTGASRGEPAFPRRFQWRDREYTVAAVLERWAERSARHGEGEQYTRKHWYRVRTDDGTVMSIYFERQARTGKAGSRPAKTRWWLYGIET